MPINFEDSSLHKTLFIVKTGDGKYRLNQFYQITTQEGVAYLRPLPSGVGVASLAHLGLAFDAVEFVTEPRSNADGLRNLTHATVTTKQRMGP